jgi:hypothetical protein
MVAALQTRQAPPQEVAQQKPEMQEPEAHSMPSMQAAPAGFLVQTPAWQVRPSPQAVPLATGWQLHIVAAVQARQGPAQALAQQRPPTQAPERHSVPATQVSPLAFLAGGAQTAPMQVWPMGQGVAVIWQTPAAVQVNVVRVVPLQVAARQEVPAASRRQAPMPLQPLLQASSRQAPVGSVPPTGTGLQVPSLPSTLQAMQVPAQAEAQQRPWAQMPGAAQSLFLAHRAPTGRPPHDPSVQTLGAAH